MSTQARSPGPRTVPTVLLAGLLAGALDIGYAMAFWGLRGVPAERILQSVASGVYGPDAFQGGAATAAAGAGLHFLISCAVAAAYYLAARSSSALARRPLLAGPLFGLAMWAAMNVVVVPLSAARAPEFGDPAVVVGGLLAHAFLFGLPIALVVRAALRR